MVVMRMGSMIARTRPDHQRTLQIGGHRLVGVRLRRDQGGNPLGGETMLQARPHPAGDQDLNHIQRMRFARRTLVKRLLDG